MKQKWLGQIKQALIIYKEDIRNRLEEYNPEKKLTQNDIIKVVNKGLFMPRPRNKQDLLKAGEEYYAKLIEMADGMSENEMNTEFDFSGDPSKKERHWGRDKNLRDIWVHLYEWHRMLLEFVDTNLNKGGNAPFLPEPYTWKTYGDMNVEYWKKHQKTSLADARKMFEKSHKDVMKLAESLSEEQLFTKGMYPWVGGSVLGSYFVSCLSSHYDWAMKKLKAHKKNCEK